MFLSLTLIALVLAGYVAWAIGHAWWRGRSFHQSLLYLPLKVFFRISEGQPAPLRSDPPVIYAILHQSRLDPALMLSLLPSDTLHILDETSARSFWLEPWREMARTIAFNARHIFVSRRLVRMLKGKGRLAVYLPDGVDPDTRPFRLYRAVARIAQTAGAEIVAVSVRGSRDTTFAHERHRGQHMLPRLSITALPALSVDALRARSASTPPSAARALHERLLEADGQVVI